MSPDRDPDSPEHIASVRARAIVWVLRDPELRAEIVAILREAAPRDSASKETDLTEVELSKLISSSRATIKRTIVPSRHVGRSPRYDVADVRAQLEARGKKASTPAKRAPVSDVDVSASVKAAGLVSADFAPRRSMRSA